MATQLLINGSGVLPLQINPEYLPYGGSLVSSVNGETGAITITGSGIATISTPAPNTIDVNVPAGAAQTLSQLGNIVSLSGGGGSVDIATTTLVSATATKTTQQTYVGGGFLETQFGGQVKSLANIVSAPPLGGNSASLQGGNATLALGANNASILPAKVEFQDGTTLNTADISFDGTSMNVNGLMTFPTTLPQSAVVPSAGDDLVNKTYVDGLFPPTADTLANVLLAGNNAGATAIDMNQQEIQNAKTITIRDDTDNIGVVSFLNNLGVQKAQIDYNGSLGFDKITMSGTSVILDGSKGNIEVDVANWIRLQTQDNLPIILVRQDALSADDTRMSLEGSGVVKIGNFGLATPPTLKLEGDTGNSFQLALDDANNRTDATGLLRFPTTLPQSAVVPTLGDELVNKTYADGLVGSINITDTDANATYYPTFVSTDGVGQPVYIDKTTTPMTYNPSTSTLTATTFSGSLNGTATNATNVATTATTTNATYYPTFVDATTGNNAIEVDTGLTYNPSTKVMTLQELNLTRPFYFTDWNSLDGGDFTWTPSGAGSGLFYNTTFDASLKSVAELRSGLYQMSTGAVNGNNYYVQSANKTWLYSNIKSLTCGFIPLGNGTLGVVGTDAGNLTQSFGVVVSTSVGDTQNGIMWRLTSATAAIPTWTLVEDNVVKETLSGANLTGGLTNKWCRASIVFTNNGANYYGTFTNLTDGATYTTATYATTINNPYVHSFLYFHTGTTNATSKAIAFDYCYVVPNTPPIGTTTAVATSR